jgi:putative aldouronate transport system permease protein
VKKPGVYEGYYISMLVPGVALLLIFNIAPMVGLAMAFQRYTPSAGIFGSEFVGLRNFEVLFSLPAFPQVVRNTLIISVSKIILSLAVPIFFALMLNEARNRFFKRTVQTVVYLPNFLSWVIVGSMFINFFSSFGVVNGVLQFFGLPEPIIFMASNTWFRPIVVFTDIWKNFGFSAIVYISAITAISPELYESADMDGASRWQKMRFITLPGMTSIIVIMATLALGNILNAGFDQIFNLFNPSVYETGNVLDTYTYQLAFGQGATRGAVQRFDLATGVGLLKSSIGFALIVAGYRLAYQFADYTIF